MSSWEKQKIMKLFWTYARQYKKLLIGAMVLAIFNQGFSLLDPQIFRVIVDDYASNIDFFTRSAFMRGVGLWLLAFVCVAMVSRIAKNFQEYFGNVAVQRIGAHLYADSVAHSFSLPYSVFEDQRSGELLQKMQKARDDTQRFILSFINVVFFSLVGIVFVLAYAFYVHWLAGLTYLLMIPIIALTTVGITKRIKEAQADIVKESAILAGSTTETMRNVELVKSLGLQNQETDRLNNVNAQILGLEIKKVKLIRIMLFLQGTLLNALRVSILFVLLWLLFDGSTTLGEFFILYFYSFLVFNPLGQLGDVATAYQEAKASMEALNSILHMKSESKPKDPRKIEHIDSIEYKNVGFIYQTVDIPSVQHISLSIVKGSTVAFAGPSGSGKTTLVKLLVGLYRPTTGDIFFNRISSKRIGYESVRNRIGYVSQEAQLFAGTIRENLLFVRPRATDTQCIEALRAAHIESIINRGDYGLDTKIGEGGLKLSGGERQRLAIARALLREPDVIIFDEATSSLDALTEKEITITILEIARKRPNLITIIVAHRLSNIAHADKIYVLEKGRLVEQATHRELVQKENGLYRALWRQQQAQ